MSKYKASEVSVRVNEEAIQIRGGYGYTREYPVERWHRDAKIFSIYEGTNHIQALDLVSRKLGARGGADLADFLKEVGDFVAEHAGRSGLAAEITAVGEASAALQRAAGALLEFFMGGKVDQVTLVANAFLETLAEVAVSHLLLDAAGVAEGRLRRDEDELSAEDVAFYRGKVMAAKHYVNYVLPNAHARVAAMVGGDRSALDIPDAGFSTV